MKKSLIEFENEYEMKRKENRLVFVLSIAMKMELMQESSKALIVIIIK